MARKSAIRKLPAEQRKYVEKLLREDRLTLDEMLAAIRAQFPTADVPSRSSLGRYKQAVDAIAERIRGQREVARVWVAELGENPDDKSGELLVQTITALANDVALRAANSDEVDAADVSRLARIVNQLSDASARTLKTRKAMRAEALQDVKAVAKEAGVPEDVMALIDAKLMGQ